MLLTYIEFGLLLHAACTCILMVQGVREKRDDGEDNYPYSYGVNLAISDFAQTHPHDKVRDGSASLNSDCWVVRNITDDMRNSSIMYLGIDDRYTKHTLAYGLPVIGSDNVTDVGLQRACYAISILLSSRFDILNALYHNYIRFALIGDGEELTDLTSYATLDSNVNMRMRGIGASLQIPMCSAGDDNQRCKLDDVYFTEDIFLHEASHGILTLGARFVIPKFEMRLQEIYDNSVVRDGKWADTYAAENRDELWAVGSQVFFNALHTIKYQNLGVYDHATLKQYDPDLYDLIAEVHPCWVSPNDFINRCAYKDCDLEDTFVFRYPSIYHIRSQCPVIKNFTDKPTHQECASMVCHYKGNAFNFKPDFCQILNCSVINGYMNLDLIQKTNEDGFDIYEGLSGQFPSHIMTLDKEKSAVIKSLCVKGPEPARCIVPVSERLPCGENIANNDTCWRMGCCYSHVDNFCYSPDQITSDKHMYCDRMANDGKCDTNPNYMYITCPMTCGVAHRMHEMDIEDVKTRCQDKDLNCPMYTGYCHLSFYRNKCQITCGICVPTNPLTK